MHEILLLTATAFEQLDLAVHMRETVHQIVAGKNWRKGRLGQAMVQLVETGMGAVNTAHALTCVLESTRPALVLQVGVGGAYLDAGLGKGAVVVASSEIYGDVGVRTREGWQSAELIGIPLLQQEEAYFNHFPLDKDLVSRARDLLVAGAWDGAVPEVRVGPFVTVQECSGLTALGREREGRFRALCENMEGAAAAHLCRLYGIPFLEIRSISNLVEDRRTEQWDLPLAGARAQQAGLCLLHKAVELLGSKA
jgi:futalosine hydrolase